jgi:hypothetical protein
MLCPGASLGLYSSSFPVKSSPRKGDLVLADVIRAIRARGCRGRTVGGVGRSLDCSSLALKSRVSCAHSKRVASIHRAAE